MPKLDIVVPHQLAESEALERIKGLLGQLKQEHSGSFTDLEEQWTDTGGRFSMKAMGMAVSGGLSVAPGQVQMKGNLPLAATPFKGRIEQIVRDRMERLLT